MFDVKRFGFEPCLNSSILCNILIPTFCNRISTVTIACNWQAITLIPLCVLFAFTFGLLVNSSFVDHFLQLITSPDKGRSVY